MGIDPVELTVAEGLARAGIRFERINPDNTLDFYLPDHDIYVEVKQFWTERAVHQMAQAKDVILIQGLHAAEVFARMINAPVSL